MTMLSSQHGRRGVRVIAAVALLACAVIPAFAGQEVEVTDQKQQAVELLKSIETGDPRPLAYINPDEYIQHNLAVADGPAGVKALLQSLPKGSARVNRGGLTKSDTVSLSVSGSSPLFRFPMGAR